MPYSVPAATTTAVAFKVDDYVLYRDPARFWRGEPGHTFVCRIAHIERYTSGQIRYTLNPVTGGLVRDVQGDYMRLLLPADAMRDIDTASLDEGSSMTPAAVAWLRQHARPQDGRPELPSGC